MELIENANMNDDRMHTKDAKILSAKVVGSMSP